LHGYVVLAAMMAAPVGPGEVVKGYRTAAPEGLADASALWRW
jgi:hypothetical protein